MRVFAASRPIRWMAILKAFISWKILGLAGSVLQTFDGAGNVTRTHTGVDLSWNIAAGRLETATVNQRDQNYQYDATGRRSWTESDDGSTTERTVYIYSGPNVIAEYTEGDSATTPGNEYAYAGGIDSLALVVHNNNATRLSVLRNQQWSVVALVNLATGSLAELYGYNVFGERTILDPVDGSVRSTSVVNNRYGYTGRHHDRLTGLMYYRARYYDPATGEFISPDPSEYIDGMSLYRGYFVPLGVDPKGRRFMNLYAAPEEFPSHAARNCGESGWDPLKPSDCNYPEHARYEANFTLVDLDRRKGCVDCRPITMHYPLFGKISSSGGRCSKRISWRIDCVCRNIPDSKKSNCVSRLHPVHLRQCGKPANKR